MEESFCGFSFEFEHVNGDTELINFKNKMNVIQPNDTQKILNFGMIRNSIVGNLIIEFHVEFPLMLSKDQVARLDFNL